MLVLFVSLYGTFAQFMWLVVVHELVHKMPFHLDSLSHGSTQQPPRITRSAVSRSGLQTTN
jgi:hypothetical protein